jgi:transposase
MSRVLNAGIIVPEKSIFETCIFKNLLKKKKKKKFSDAVVQFRQESGLEYEEEIKREDLFFDWGQ